jgi:UDP:flavonoid glycosyltransferase YjiC (YdhE family)
MRVLMTTLPGHGHLGPLLPLAAAIRDSGCEVKVATSETYREMVLAHGLSFATCGPLWRESDFGKELRSSHLLSDLGPYLHFEVMPRAQADLRNLVGAWMPDVVVSNDFEPNGRVVAEQFGVPFALVSNGPRLARATRERMQGPIWRASRRAGGLPEEGGFDYSVRWLHLHACPEEYRVEIASDGPCAIGRTEFAFRPEVVEYGECFDAGPLFSLKGRPVALCTLGTVFNKNAELMRELLLGITPHVQRLYVLPGPGVDLGVVVASHSNVLLLPDTKLSSILPSMDLVITHGGTSTLTAVQRSGVPAVLFPLGADQIFNAAACQRLQLAVVRFHTPAVTSLGMPVPPVLSADVVRGAMEQALADPRMRDRCEAYRRQVENLPSLAVAARLIKQLGLSRAPILRSAGNE